MRLAALFAVLLAAGCGAKPEFSVDVVDAGAPAAPAGVVGVSVDEPALRFKSYDAVFGGASGIRYLRPAAAKPERTLKAEAVARELRLMAPVFTRGRPIPPPFAPPTDGWMARAWTYRGRDYLILANRTKDRQWKVPAAALKPTWRPLFELRRDPRELLKKHLDAFYLKPHQVLVLESRLRPKRLFGR